MKLATLRDGSRDGLLAVVSRDLSLAHVATGRARTLQQVLDDWNFLSPQLEDLSVTLNQGKARHAFSFDPRQCMAPLPRAFCWVQPEGSGEALAYRAGDRFLAATEEAPEPTQPAQDGPDGTGALVHAGLAVLTGDIAAGTLADPALEGVRLLLLAAHWTAPLSPLNAGAPPQRTAFAPLAVTPDELGSAWQQGRVQARVHLQVGRQAPISLAADQAGLWQPLGFGPLLARLALDGPVQTGSLVGSGPLGQHAGGLRAGDVLRLDCTGSDGMSVFGALAQRVAGAD